MDSMDSVNLVLTVAVYGKLGVLRLVDTAWDKEAFGWRRDEVAADPLAVWEVGLGSFVMVGDRAGIASTVQFLDC